MASDTRTVIRSIQNSHDKQKMDEALNIGHAAIEAYDIERDFNSSIEILKELLNIVEEKKDFTSMIRYLSNLKVRYLILGKNSEFSQLLAKYTDIPNSPFAPILDSLNQMKEDEDIFVLESIEKQTIFGNFTPIEITPFLSLSNKEDAIRVIEDYYENGRYIINLLNMKTQLHESMNIDVGITEEVDIVEREQFFKI